MDNETALPKRARLNPYGKALRRERIFARLRGGWSYEDIAREERVTPRRVRQIVSEALQRQQVDGGSDHAMLQRARLENALRLSAGRIAEGEIGAIAPYLKVLAQRPLPERGHGQSGLRRGGAREAARQDEPHRRPSGARSSHEADGAGGRGPKLARGGSAGAGEERAVQFELARKPLKSPDSRKKKAWIPLPQALDFLPKDLDFPSL